MIRVGTCTREIRWDFSAKIATFYFSDDLRKRTRLRIGNLRLTYQFLQRRRCGSSATLTASAILHAFLSVRIRHNPRHSAGRTTIRADDGSGGGGFASAAGKEDG